MPAAAPPPRSTNAPTDAAWAAGTDGVWTLRGDWTLAGLGALLRTNPLPAAATPVRTLDGAALGRLDSAGAWVLQGRMGAGAAPTLRAWPEHAATLMHEVQAGAGQVIAQPQRHSPLQDLGRSTLATAAQAQALLHFLGELGMATVHLLRHPRLWRTRAMAHEIQIGGLNALPIIGLTSFLLGVVVAYQGADQLRHYGANVFVVELVGYAMLREFAPLIGAIIIAGRSGSAYAAQLGTMVVAEEIDALHTLGIQPLQRLVLPKITALALALPLLTVFGDITGVMGGMVMARTRLDISFGDFITRFGSVMQGSALLLGVGKSLVFAVIIATIGCFQGLRTRGSADSVGRQTTLSVVQSIFLVIVADALFSVVFNRLDL
jgi:phospholipid/cholesterol/gamma-HCH transport system permease protein